MTDLISRADAIEAVMAEGRKVYASEYANAEWIVYEADAVEALSMLPSAEAEPIVIRSKTLLPTKDFKEWAKRIREVNPNAVVIPCEAEVVSADAVSREVKEDDKFNTCNNHSNNADADYKSHIRGEWEHWGSPFSDESEVIDTIVCSVCGARFIEPKDEAKGEYNYCPNCGARMKGGAE